MMPPPPRSTLFPYTTLFRSTIVDLAPAHRQAITAFVSRRAGVLKSAHEPLQPQERAGLVKGLRAIVAALETADRKSTRLNSSHANISYAVFCLKKKKLRCAVRRNARAQCCSRWPHRFGTPRDRRPA